MSAADLPAISPSRPLRVLALAKQVPVGEDMQLADDGRLVREGLELHMNDYCRRAVAKGLEIAKTSGGSLSVLTLGPPSADTVCREAVAFGADRGVHVSDPAFAGSDTLATAKALAAAIRLLGQFDLILCGRNSVDADTGQVPPQLAQILDLPFACGVRELSLRGDHLSLLLEHDDEWLEVETELPCLLSCAERLCDPCKIKDPGIWASVDAKRIESLNAADLGAGPWGAEASPTWVGDVRSVQVDRRREVLQGSLPDQVERAIEVLTERGAFTKEPREGDSAASTDTGANPPVPGRDAHSLPAGAAHPLAVDATPQAVKGADASSLASEERRVPVVAVIAEPGRERGTRELLGAAADLAAAVGGRVTALGEPAALEVNSGRWGADEVVRITPSETRSAPPLAEHLPTTIGAETPEDNCADPPASRFLEEDLACAALNWAERTKPWAILTLGTPWGREVASRLAVGLGAGLTGDAVGLACVDGRLVADKPAFGGRLVAAIGCTSEVQMATVRSGVFPLPSPRLIGDIPVFAIPATRRGRVQVISRRRDDDSSLLARAEVVIGVGRGVDTSEYPSLRAAAKRIGAELCATRKVTDAAAMPRARQVGITGHTIAPRLYIAVGISGRFNHTVGVQSSGSIVAVNTDPDAPIFDWCDVGFIGDWRDVLNMLIPRLETAVNPLSALT